MKKKSLIGWTLKSMPLSQCLKWWKNSCGYKKAILFDVTPKRNSDREKEVRITIEEI